MDNQKNAQSVEGTWKFTQKWEGLVPYSFDAEFDKDGNISIMDGTFFGTYMITPTGHIMMAIADFENGNESIGMYAGQKMKNVMEGSVVASNKKTKKVSHAEWSAKKVEKEESDKGFHFP